MILFELTEKEEKKYQKFYREHQALHGSDGAIGGRYTFIMVPTSIGDAIEVKCSRCHKKLTLREL